MCVWHIRIALPDDGDAIVNAALAGNEQATMLLGCCANIARQLSNESNAAALSCLICDAPLWQRSPPMAIVVVTEWDDLSAPLAFGVCGRCCARHPTAATIKAAVLGGWGARLGEPLRQLPPLAAVTGHA